jgi:hypothetical protein
MSTALLRLCASTAIICDVRLAERTSTPKPLRKQGKDSSMDETPTFDARITCPICGGAIPAVKMDVRFLARYTCPTCGNSILIEGDKPQA